MRRGDLSNQTTPRILIDFDLLIVGEVKLNILEKTKLILKGEDIQKYEFDVYKIHYLYRLIRDTNLSITLVTTNPRILKGFEEEPLLPCDLRYVKDKNSLKDLLYTVYSYSYFVTEDNMSDWNYLPRHLKVISFEDFVQQIGVK